MKWKMMIEIKNDRTLSKVGRNREWHKKTFICVQTEDEYHSTLGFMLGNADERYQNNQTIKIKVIAFNMHSNRHIKATH